MYLKQGLLAGANENCGGRKNWCIVCLCMYAYISTYLEVMMKNNFGGILYCTERTMYVRREEETQRNGRLLHSKVGIYATITFAAVANK